MIGNKGSLGGRKGSVFLSKKKKTKSQLLKFLIVNPAKGPKVSKPYFYQKIAKNKDLLFMEMTELVIT